MSLALAPFVQPSVPPGQLGIASYVNRPYGSQDEIGLDLSNLYAHVNQGMGGFVTAETPVQPKLIYWRIIQQIVIPGALEIVREFCEVHTWDKGDELSKLAASLVTFGEEGFNRRGYYGPHQTTSWKIVEFQSEIGNNGMKIVFPEELKGVNDFTFLFTKWLENVRIKLANFMLRECVMEMLTHFSSIYTSMSKVIMSQAEMNSIRYQLFNIARSNPNECINKILQYVHLTHPDVQGAENLVHILIPRSVEAAIQGNSNMYNMNGPHALANREARIDERRNTTSYIGGLAQHFAVPDEMLADSKLMGSYIRAPMDGHYKTASGFVSFRMTDEIPNALNFKDGGADGKLSAAGKVMLGNAEVIWDLMKTLPNSVIKKNINTIAGFKSQEWGDPGNNATRLLEAHIALPMDPSDDAEVKLHEAPHVWLRQLLTITTLPDHGNKIKLNQSAPQNIDELGAFLIQATTKRNTTVNFSNAPPLKDAIEKLPQNQHQSVAEKIEHVFNVFKPSLLESNTHISSHTVEPSDRNEHYIDAKTFKVANINAALRAGDIPREITDYVKRVFPAGDDYVASILNQLITYDTLSRLIANDVKLDVEMLVFSVREMTSLSVIVSRPKVLHVAAQEKGSFISLGNHGENHAAVNFQYGKLLVERNLGVVIPYVYNHESDDYEIKIGEKITPNVSNSVCVLVRTGDYAGVYKNTEGTLKTMLGIDTQFRTNNYGSMDAPVEFYPQYYKYEGGKSGHVY